MGGWGALNIRGTAEGHRVVGCGGVAWGGMAWHRCSGRGVARRTTGYSEGCIEIWARGCTSLHSGIAGRTSGTHGGAHGWIGGQAPTCTNLHQSHHPALYLTFSACRVWRTTRRSWRRRRTTTRRQGLTLLYFPPQPEPLLSQTPPNASLKCA